MNVLRMVWLGLPSQKYEASVEFFRDVLGLRVEFADADTTEFCLSNDDRVQVFGAGHHYFEFFEQHAHGPVPLFEVADLDQAKSEFDAAGIEVIGQREVDENWAWIHVRAPDGNLYEFAARHATPAAQP